MDRSRQTFVLSSSSKHSSIPKSSISDETNENKTSLDRIDFKPQNPKKTVSKHFMSSTIVATTKASVPRKKILSEKNETPFDICLQNSLNLDSRSSLEDGDKFHSDRPFFRSSSAYYCSSESDGDEHTLSVKPYNPLTDYLSPRPKYLRYNPNRRHKILDLQEFREEKKDDSSLPPVSYVVSQKLVNEQDSLEGSRDSLMSPAQEGSAKPENQEQLGKVEDDGDNDDGSAKLENQEQLGKVEDDQEGKEEEDQEEEESEEYRGCSFKGMVKSMLLLFAIAFLTSYIFPVDNVGPPFEQITAKHSLANYSLIIQQEAQIDNTNLNWVNSYAEVISVHGVFQDEDEAVEMTDKIVQTLQAQNRWNKYTLDPSDELLIKLPVAKRSGTKSLDDGHTEFKGVDLLLPEGKCAENKDTLDKITERFDQIQLLEIPEIGAEKSQELKQGSQGIQLTRFTKNHDDFPEEQDKPLDSERMVDQHMHFGRGSFSETEKAADFYYEVEELTENHMNKRAGEFVQQKGDKTLNSGPIEDAGVNMEEGELWSQETTKDSVQKETFLSTLMDIDNTGPTEDARESNLSQEIAKENLQDETFQYTLRNNDSIKYDEKSTKPIVTVQGGIAAAYTLVSLLVLILSFLVYIYAPQAGQGPPKDAKLVTVSLQESNTEVKSNQAPLSVDLKHMEEKYDTILKPSTAVLSSEEAVRENSYIQAPNIQLLGELAIGEVYNSHRSGYSQAKTIDSNRVEESTKSSYVDVLPTDFVAATYSSIEDSTTAESPSYGSFSAKMKISKKQSSKDRNVTIMATPVRRSSRIRNLTAASP